MQEDYDGLLRDKTRPSRIRPLGSNITERVVTLTQTDPPAEATYWTAAHDGESRRHQGEFRPTHLARAWPPAAPGPAVQALQRSEVHRLLPHH
jgi:hypothetical protein